MEFFSNSSCSSGTIKVEFFCESNSSCSSGTTREKGDFFERSLRLCIYRRKRYQRGTPRNKIPPRRPKIKPTLHEEDEDVVVGDRVGFKVKKNLLVRIYGCTLKAGVFLYLGEEGSICDRMTDFFGYQG